ncbi:MAG: EAL domain-containing protein [Proteobacteria bacterium]|nr:EAL domain-containing protein [Pseudomonadota bacterium]
MVEDSEDDALLLETVLAPVMPGLEIHRVDCAPDMTEALNRPWDLVISDHSMPRFDAFRALQVLKASGQDIPFIIYSGALEHDRGNSAMRVGADDHIDKGNFGRLVPVVQRALRHVRTTRGMREAEQSRTRLENYDGLTGLANQKRFLEIAGAGLEAGCAVLYVDLDRFMRINDSFGYATGDALMGQIARRLERCAGPGEVVARIGRDEFALIVAADGSRDTARQRAERLMQCFSEAFPVNGQSLFLTISIGIALAPWHGEDVPTLLKNAESAMFDAKRQGRNMLQFYRHELNVDTGLRLKLESALRHAVEREELFLAYQPIIDVETRSIRGVEALVRWRHPELGTIPPDQFIGIADESGQIIAIGEWVLRTACAQARKWHDAGFPDLAVAVNFSATQFKQPGLHDTIRQVLESCGLAPQHLEVEITESLAMQDAEATATTLRGLKDMGVKISIDDFGTGYSSLGYLRRFPIDILKIDKSFVRDVDCDDDSAAIIRTVVGLARSLKLTVLAEGVETQSQLDFLAAEGCDRMQGYYFAKPCDPATLLKLLRSQGAGVPSQEPLFAAA